MRFPFAAAGLLSLMPFAVTLPVSGQTPPPPPTRVVSSAVSERDRLLQSVDAIYAPGGLAGSLVLLSDSAFPVVVGGGREASPVVAATKAGNGRVVVFAHGAFLSADGLAKPGNANLLANAVAWCGGNKRSVRRVGIVGEAAAGNILRGKAAIVRELPPNALTDSGLSGIDVLIVRPNAFDAMNGGQERANAVGRWVQKGGGLITYGVGWGWLQLNEGRDLSTAGFNRLLVPLGIGVGSDTNSPTGTGGAFRADARLSVSMTAADALTRLEANASTLSSTEAQAIARALASGTEVLPDNEKSLLPRLHALMTAHGYANSGVFPTKLGPVTNGEPVARVAALLEARRIAAAAPEKVGAHPSAVAFPGRVPAEAKRIQSRVVEFDAAVPGWHTTGLYAAPGEVITVSANGAEGKNLGVRIGAHKDRLWNLASWPRFPEITVEKKLGKDGNLRIACAFGGTIFITVPDNGTSGASPSPVSVTISGGVEQPRFVAGKTTPTEWSALRNAPAPWAELVGKKIALTVPSTVVRGIADPTALVTYWDEVAIAATDLYGASPSTRRPERYCVDIEISAGYMHSGYPIMVHDDVERTIVSLRTLRGNDGDKTWGFYHELGHNHQKPDWTWEGMGEVSNNFFSLYGGETFNAVKPDYSTAHNAIAPAPRRENLIKYLAGGADYEKWKSDPFLALGLFIQLRQAFGWEPFQKVFREYVPLPDAERPKTDLAKHDQFMTRFSRAVGRNLGPFFQAWGIATSDAARQSVQNLPAWMPPDWPTPAEIAAAK